MKKAKTQGNVNKTLKNLIPIAVFVVVLVLLTLAFLPQIKELATPEGREKFKVWVDSLGFCGWLVTLGIQLLQIFVAFVPGEPVELVLGYVWGPLLGTFTCLLGIFIGTATIYLFVRKFGNKFVSRAVGDRDITRYKFLSTRSRAELTVFILFFIPGTPKDALTYIAPLAPIPTISYLLITTFARIPSIVTSTILGDSIANGNYILAIIVFALTAIISVLGIILGNRFVERRNKENLNCT
jgi:uncharacterized membrane protein YdjX (TVP38/TMEM64 family)